MTLHPGVDLAAALSVDVLEAARWLLGCRIRSHRDGETTEVWLTEVEAYAGDLDPASHSYRGRTPRNEAMFGPPGTLYVYRSHGRHWCMNVVVGEEGVPHAVLLRGGEPTRGVATMVIRRHKAHELTNGPGKLSQALGVTGADNGTSLSDGPIRLLADTLPSGYEILTTPRIGISRAADLPWRFVAITR